MSGALSWPFLRLYVLTLLYFSANSILNVIIPLRGAALGASNTSIGLIMGAYMLAAMLLRPWAGQVIQRHGPMKVLRIVLVINGAAIVLYTMTGLEGYFVARIMQGVSTAFFSMALQLGIIDALPEKERSQGISLYSLFSYIPGILGPFLALGIWQGGNLTYFSIVMITIAVVTGLAGFSAAIDKNEISSAKTEQQINTWKSFSQLIQNPFLLRCSVLMLVASMVFGAVTAFVPLYAAQLEKANAALYLMLQAGMVVFARFVLRRKIPSDGKWHSSFMMGAVLLLTTASLCISFSSWGGVILLYSGAVFMGTAQALIYPSLTTYLSFVLPEANRNVLLGLFIATADLGISLGGVLMGPVADLYSYEFMYMICAVISALLIMIAYERKPANTSTKALQKQR